MSTPANSGPAKPSARSLATAYAEIDKLKEHNERLAEQLQVLGGFGTLISTLDNGLGSLVGELQPLRDLARAAAGTEPPGTPLDECASNRLRSIRASLDRVRSDTYQSTLSEADVGFLHDTPEGPYPCGPGMEAHGAASTLNRYSSGSGAAS